MYGKCGQMREAKEAFDSIKEPNVFSSTIFLTAYAQNGHIVAAKSFFDQMSERNIYSWTTLITSFASYKDLESALDTASHRDIVSWNTLLQGYVDWELIEEAANLFERMPAHNAVSCTSVISGFSLVGDFDRGQSVISSILQWDVVAVNAMLQFLAEFGLIQEAFGVLKKSPAHSVVTWTSIVTAYARSGYLDKARFLFEKMPERNSVTWNTLLMSYAHAGRVDVAEKILGYFPQHSTVAWNSMLKAYGDAMNLATAKDFFDKMPYRSTQSWNVILDAYAGTKNLEESFSVFTSMPQHDEFSWSILILLVSDSGNVDQAINLFNKMPYQNVLCCNALLQAYAQTGNMHPISRFLCQSNLLGIRPNQTTFASVLTGISYVGALEDARSCFGSMVWDHGIPASAMHFCCVVDVLGRAGQIKDAMDLVDSLPYNPMEVEWTALLGASKTQGDIRTGALVASRVTEFDSHNSAAYSLLSNVCSFASEIEVP
ncbi:hypothetical protein SELMODRAFT_111830 [Selaginella moellendorffii]|uniref:Pentacotripeptide-repeat region of PRORP domain-containing protein n=1 Tax=Selaginella moellendorffii TaxID=88036 RepID=D8S997_SELML|nr:hypothetical protein SELMODRAFT_111830 [Selaginella moellendorffii]